MDVSLFSNAHHHHHYHHLGFGAPLHTTVIPPHPSLHPHPTHPYHHDELSPQISPVVHPDAMYGQILGQEYSAVYPPPSEAALYHATHPYSSQNYEFLFASPTHVHTTALAPYDHHTTPPLTPKTPPAISASSQQHLAHNSSNEPRIFSRFHDEDEENRDEDEEMDQNYGPSDDGPLILNDPLADDSRPKGVASNKKERRRTQCINSAFTSLRDCIPNVPSDTKLSKIKTLRLASSYISYLMDLLEAPQEHSHQLLNEGFRADLTSTKRSSLQNRIETQNEIRRHLEMQLEKAKYKRLHTSSTAQRKRNCSKKSSRNSGNQECSSINVNFAQAEVHSLSSSSSSFAYVKQEVDDCALDCDARNPDCSSSHQIWSGVANYGEVATFHQRMTCNTTPLDQQPLPVSPLHSHQIPVAGGAPPHHSIIGESCSNSSERVTCNKPRTGWPEHVWAQELGAPNTQSSGSVTVSGSDH